MPGIMDVIEISRKHKFAVVIILTVIILITGTVVYNKVEGFSWVDSLYFSVITLTTVGYGDLHPETTIGKLFTAAYVLVGIGILFAFVEIFSEHMVYQRLRKIAVRRQRKKTKNSKK